MGQITLAEPEPSAAAARPSDAQKALGTKLAYGVGRIAEAIKTRAFETFVFFYYVQVLELPGSLAGLAVAIALCFDAITDPVIGSYSDSYRSKWGRRHPFMALSMLPLPFVFCALFLPPEGLGTMGLFLWLTVFAVATRGAITLFHVPHLSLGAELSSDYLERTQIVAIRTLFGIVGAAIGVGIGFFYFFRPTPAYPNGQMNPDAYPGFALACAVLMVLSIGVTIVGTKHAIPMLPQASPSHASFGPMRVYRETFEALRLPSFRALFIGLIIIAVLSGAHAALTTHLGTFFWELRPAQLGMLLYAYIGGAFLAVPMARPMHRRFDKRMTLVTGYGLGVVFTTLPVVLRLCNVMPVNGDPALLPVLMTFAALTMCFTIVGSITGGSMLADLADEYELEHGRRQEGIFFGALSFSGKAASAFGSVVAGIGMDMIRWPKGEHILPADVPREVVWQFGLLYGPILSLFGFAALFAIRGYNLTETRHRDIQRELEARRADAS